MKKKIVAVSLHLVVFVLWAWVAFVANQATPGVS
jgi:hypothetical protein